jgi:hypothetical protein
MDDLRLKYAYSLAASWLDYVWRSLTSLLSWALGGFWQFLPSGATAGALMVLWILDLFSGSALAIRKGQWVTKDDGDMPDYLAPVKPFSFRRWPLSIVKLLMWLALALACSTVRAQVHGDNQALYFLVSTAIGLIEITLIGFEFGSVLRNVALFSGSSRLRHLHQFWEQSAQTALDRMAPLKPIEKDGKK